MDSQIQKILEAEKEWILESGKDLDKPYVRGAGGTVITLQQMLDDINAGNERAVKQALDLVKLTCELFITPSSTIDEVVKKEREKAALIFGDLIKGIEFGTPNWKKSLEREFKNLLED